MVPKRIGALQYFNKDNNIYKYPIINSGGDNIEYIGANKVMDPTDREEDLYGALTFKNSTVSNLQLKSFTLAAWINMGKEADTLVLINQNPPPWGTRFNIIIAGNATNNFFVRYIIRTSLSKSYMLETDRIIKDQKWYHIAVTRDEK